MNIIGINVRKIRESKAWTQEQLVVKCHLAKWDISRGTLAKIEAKVRRVTDIEVRLLSIVLNVPVGNLFDD
ncbi:MAG: transcriptional regulator with XRE-family HTH domain [Flavobacteriales bacterium]|jgi:transcriptional regulator with XRE-family HTH domain